MRINLTKSLKIHEAKADGINGKSRKSSKHSQGFKYTLINTDGQIFKIPKKRQKSEGKYQHGDPFIQ